jgi:hypothetical protein
MPRRVSASTARPAAATATTTTASSSTTTTTTTTTTIVANSTTTTTAEEGSATAGPSSSSKSLPLSPPAQAAYSSATLVSASASSSKLGDGTQATAASRPRRIMPSRSRRGGPGVGISDVDTHILETLRRRRAFPSPPSFLLPPMHACSALRWRCTPPFPLLSTTHQSLIVCLFFFS